MHQRVRLPRFAALAALLFSILAGGTVSAQFIPGGGTPSSSSVTGTGFWHSTSGTLDSAASLPTPGSQFELGDGTVFTFSGTSAYLVTLEAGV